MAVFAYKGRSGASAVNGEIEADSRPAAVAALRSKGVVATQVQEKKAKTAAVTAKRADGTTKSFEAIVRIDTPQEVLYYQHGGILQYVLRQLLAAK